ncbi:MDR family MFS transporter [Arthrobacter sp. NEB 688]|uniref:MDR family MFS transporter n=1 Tax=Arthrobacter sp. NEB 688 TaxID=904039 RepID=UPI001565912E|nr:MDR family MFS transporter [Arthrobacter sp. NEB 688]QKE83309.1 multidrug efflux MFS transporter [Arthrobacter sp. NEB 688]
MTTTDSTTPLPVPAAAAPDAPARTYPVLRWLVAATFTVILNETVMVNAIPRLMAQFDVGARAAQWLSTAFMLTMAVVIPVTGWFLQRVTTRLAFTVAMSVFGAGTLVCALAPTFPVLVGGRVVQAAGTAVMMPLLMTTLMTVVDERDRGRVMGNVTLAISVAPALGPALSGVVLAAAGWRWLFGLVLPVAVLVTVLGLRHLADVGETRVTRVDWASVLLSALGFGALVYGLSRVGEEHPGAVPAWGWALGGLLVVAGFVVRQRSLTRRSEPLLDLRALTHRTYTVSLAMQSLAFLTMLGAMIVLPLYLQDLRGLSPLQTGLLVAPGGIAMGLLGPVVGRVLDRVGARPLVVPGALAVLASLAALSRLSETTPFAVLLGVQVLLMVGLAALFTPAFTLGLGALPPHLYPHGSSLLGTAQQVSAAVGTALTVTVLSWRSAQLAAGGASEAAAYVGGVRAAFTVAAVLAVGVVGLALLLPNRLPSPAPVPVDPRPQPDGAAAPAVP